MPPSSRGPRWRLNQGVGLVVSRSMVVALAAATSEAADWQPLRLVVALALLHVLADSVVVWARRIRVAAGCTVQVVTAALLGPAPAVAIALLSTSIDSLVNRSAVRRR
jgi:hypothetical protein